MKNDIPEISVIVPVYNSESTIYTCIESILAQTFADIELILIDDGCQDKSGEICEEYARKDECVTVIHQSNRGRTAARAAGVAAASGRWICFVDSDDALPPRSLSMLIDSAGDDTDIVLGNGYTLPGETRESIPMADFRHLAVRAEGTIGVPWGSLYRHTVVTPEVFDLPREIMNGEDYVFWLRVVFRTDKPVRVVYENVYCKGDDHTCNNFDWTAEYCRRLHEYRKSSIPQPLHAEYMKDMIADRWVNLYAVALQHSREEWEGSAFYQELLTDMTSMGMSVSLEKKLFLNLPSKGTRSGFIKLGGFLGQIFRGLFTLITTHHRLSHGAVVAGLLCMSALSSVSAVTYTRADSLKVVRLLEQGKRQPEGTNMPLFFANQLKGIPYVAATLEVNRQEELVVNLRQLDCTTLVENVVALTRAVRNAQPSFEEFCRELETIRYKDGMRDGYASRNHYFSGWIDSNEKMGIVEEIKGKEEDAYRPFIAIQKLNLNYMSTYPDKYPMLKGNADGIGCIAAAEKALSGTTVRYIPLELLGKGKDVLGDVHDGDILAIVTKKSGLDISHLGFAVWQDGKLHLLNASSIHKKVVLEPMTLSQYMKKHPSQLGVRVVRILP